KEFIFLSIPDVRPGLIKDRIKLRENEIKSKQKVYSEKQKQALKKPDFKEQLEAGLSSEISESNKGFAMLQKMGYKKGDSLGKSSTEGIKEPIAIKIKENRSGLGVEAKRLEDEEKKKQLREQILKRKKESSENNRIKLRENEIKSKQKVYSEKQKQAFKKPDFKEQLEAGLSSEISESNKGFAMLQKMGYKKGDSLGKSSTE
uniref:G-patch domain-containing protein n=1 Tax=Megaselia scalaris TaxID=36166 RepID=T1GKG3_MEGSC